MRLLITGNLGYVGTVLTEELRRHTLGWMLCGLDAGLFAHCLLPTDRSPDTLLDRQIYTDLRDLHPRQLSGFDALVHLGAISNDPMGSEFESVTQETNVDASVQLATMAKAAGIRNLVFASSCSVYGHSEGEACTEQSDLTPLSKYARSKVEVERSLQPLSADDFQVTCLRFATACGFSPRWRTDLVLNEQVLDAVCDGRFKVLSDGTPWRPLIHIRDMSRAVLWALTDRQKEQDPFLTINVGADHWNFQVKDLAEAIAREIPSSFIEWNEHGKPDPRSYRVDFSLFKSLAPKHQPEYSLSRTIAEMAAGVLATDLRTTRRFSMRRLDELRALRTSGLLTPDLRWA